jgi:hypothetical protein
MNNLILFFQSNQLNSFRNTIFLYLTELNEKIESFDNLNQLVRPTNQHTV